MKLRRWFYSDMMAVSAREKLLSGLLALLAMLAIVAVSSALLDTLGAILVSMSMGAAVVLVCAVPHSPLSQPWPLVGGHLVSAIIGVAMYQWIPDPVAASALAVALAIVAMYWLHCLHPPGGAAALAAVLGGPGIHELGWFYVLAPVGLNVLVLLLAALLMNNLAPGRRYPQAGVVAESAGEFLLAGDGPDMQDILAALQEQDIYLDISPEDLRALYQATLMQAGKRRLGDVRCRDIMSTDPVVLEAQTDVALALRRLREAGIKSAAVVDEQGRIQGIVTLGDFFRQESDESAASLVSLMSSPVTTLAEDSHIIDALPLFTHGHRHHLPVVDAQRRVVGMLTRSDLLRALCVVLI